MGPAQFPMVLKVKELILDLVSSCTHFLTDFGWFLIGIITFYRTGLVLGSQLNQSVRSNFYNYAFFPFLLNRLFLITKKIQIITYPPIV